MKFNIKVLGAKAVQQTMTNLAKVNKDYRQPLTLATLITDPDDANAEQDAGSTTQDLRPIFNQGNELDWEDTVYDPGSHERVNPEDYTP